MIGLRGLFLKCYSLRNDLAEGTVWGILQDAARDVAIQTGCFKTKYMNYVQPREIEHKIYHPLWDPLSICTAGIWNEGRTFGGRLPYEFAPGMVDPTTGNIPRYIIEGGKTAYINLSLPPWLETFYLTNEYTTTFNGYDYSHHVTAPSFSVIYAKDLNNPDRDKQYTVIHGKSFERIDEISQTMVDHSYPVASEQEAPLWFSRTGPNLNFFNFHKKGFVLYLELTCAPKIITWENVEYSGHEGFNFSNIPIKNNLDTIEYPIEAENAIFLGAMDRLARLVPPTLDSASVKFAVANAQRYTMEYRESLERLRNLVNGGNGTIKIFDFNRRSRRRF